MLKHLKTLFNSFNSNTDISLPSGYDLRGYHIDRLMHRGGMSWVYKAWDPKGKPVIIKEFFPHKAVERVGVDNVSILADKDILFKDGFRRFHEEGRYMGMFKGPYYVRARSFFRYNNTGYMILEWERGRTLGSYIRISRSTFPDFHVVQKLSKDVIEALKRMHREQVIHLDIHPANIFLNLQGRAVLLDFGTTRHIAEPSLNSSRFYTPGFTAPEIKTNGQLGPWCDVYSFGACLKAAGFLRSHCPYSEDFKNIIRLCMTENYRHRPQNFSDPVFSFFE